MQLNERLSFELDMFSNLKNQFKNRSDYLELDQYGFLLSPEVSNINRYSKLNVDLLVCGLTHGNEVIGIEIINIMLQEILQNNATQNIAFLLNNIEAYKMNKRFVEYDLNRSFLRADHNSKLEFYRAKQIQNVIEQKINPKAIIDLHQTIEPTDSIFAVAPETPDLLQFAYAFAPNIPIVSFNPHGFSNKGKTLTEYALHRKIPALVYELGQKGFIKDRAEKFKNILMNFNVNMLTKTHQNIEYWHIESYIPNKDGSRLIPGLQSFMNVSKDQILATNGVDSFKCQFDKAVIIFPSYGEIDPLAQELAYLAVLKHLT